MNTLRTSLAVAALLACGLAVAQTGAPAKPAAKPATAPAAKPAAAAVTKGGKGKLMTRDELRTCMTTNEQNEATAAELDKKKGEVLKERDELRAAKAESDKFETDMQAQSAALKTEIDGIKAFGAEIEAGAAKMEKAELKAKQEEYQTRANALQPKIDAFNKTRNDRVDGNKAFNVRIEAHQKMADDFNEAVEELNDKRNEWKFKCGNRSYDEADEIAIKKEQNKK
jgi:chromosome segregation ATPase